MRGRSVAAVKNRYYLHLKGREQHIIEQAARKHLREDKRLMASLQAAAQF